MSPTVDVVLPVLGRPQKPPLFTRSLWDSIQDAGQVRLTVVGEASDRRTVQAWKRVVRPQDQVLLIPRRPGTFARKVNHAYRHTKAPWLLLVGDDVEFHAGWLEAALEVGEGGAKVVGTNDKGLDRKGLVAPHPLINRAYVKQRGASWDGPGLVCHEGYWHAGVDHEIALVARDRGVWAYAEEAVIAHQHFLHGTAPMDATYRKGMSRARQDVQLLKRRKRDRAPHLTLV